MPNVGVHLLLSSRVLDHWSRRSVEAPIAPDDPLARDAFLHGAILPDAGYFPRGDRLFSELAHLFRTGELVRAMVDASATPLQRASAWGWATHVLADLAVHPLVNEAHGERVRGSRAFPITSTEDEAGHMRLEYGLDAAVFRDHPGLRAFVPRFMPPVGELLHIRDAYRRTFGWAPAEARLASDLRMGRRMALLGVYVARFHNAARRFARAEPDPAGSAVPGGSAWTGPSLFRRPAVMRALLEPIPPPSWLLTRVADLAGSFPASVDRLLEGGLERLRDHDLITGAVVDAATPSARLIAAREALAGRSGRSVDIP